MSPKFIKFLKTTLKTETKIRCFCNFTSCKIPQVLGAIDEMPIKILAPFDSKVDYFSCQQKCTVNTHALTGVNLQLMQCS